jgi:hypothetical protein
MFKRRKKCPYLHPQEAEMYLRDAIYQCGITFGSVWVNWKLLEVLDVIQQPDNEVVQAWDGLHQVYLQMHGQ